MELIPSEFQVPFAECFDMYFTGLEEPEYTPSISVQEQFRPHPAVLLQFHGIPEIRRLVGQLNPMAMAFSVAALDCRTGGLSQDRVVPLNHLKGHIIRGLDDPPEKLLFRQIFLDTQMADCNGHAKWMGTVSDYGRFRRWFNPACAALGPG